MPPDTDVGESVGREGGREIGQCGGEDDPIEMVIPFRPSPLNHALGGQHGYRGGFVTLSIGATNGMIRAAKSLFDRSYSVALP